MDLLQLRYFRLVAEEQHITHTAEKLHISQSALSKTIRSLEDELGVNLFDRKGRNIQLNENGHVFLRHVKQALNSLENGVKAVRENGQNSFPDLTIYVQAAISILPKLISGFNQKYPNIRFTITKKQYRDPYDKGGCDLIISLPLLEEVNGENTITLMEEDMLIAVPNNHWAANRPFIALKEMENESFITLVSAATYRKNTEVFCKIAGFSPKIIVECNDYVTLLEFVRTGMGVAFVPAKSWVEDSVSGITFIPISTPRCFRRVTLTWPNSEMMSSSAELFRDYAVKYFHNLL